MEYVFSYVTGERKPYYIKSIDLSIFSLEEFCYFFAHNGILLDESVMRSEFEDWIEEELSLPVLAQGLRQIRENRGSYISYFMAILESVYLYEKQEKNSIKEELLQFANKNENQRRKILGDQMFKRGKYESAMKEYYALTLDKGFEYESDAFKGKVWHNLACCYGMCFLFNEALQCFKTAYSYGFFKETQNGIAFVSKAEFDKQHEFVQEENSFVHYLDYTTQDGRHGRYEQLAERMNAYQRGVEE